MCVSAADVLFVYTVFKKYDYLHMISVDDAGTLSYARAFAMRIDDRPRRPQRNDYGIFLFAIPDHPAFAFFNTVRATRDTGRRFRWGNVRVIHYK